jgi:hypothetical protein
VAGDITTQPKQGRQAAPMSSLFILVCLWEQQIETSSKVTKVSTTIVNAKGIFAANSATVKWVPRQSV